MKGQKGAGNKILQVGAPLYYCAQCKKLMPHLETLLFVEEDSPRGFCSEGCIEKHYAPLATHYANCEKELRTKMGLAQEECLKYTNSPRLIEAALSAPHEVWCLKNGVKEEIYAFIHHTDGSKGQSSRYSVVALCTVFAGRPSFIFLLTCTAYAPLLEELRIGEKIEDLGIFLKGQEEGEKTVRTTTTGLEHKKSVLLAELIEKHAKSDISMDKYPLYEQFLEETLRTPDEIYEYPARDGDKLFTYIKAYSQGGVSFYYFVICVKANPEVGGNESESVEVIPILSFPSLDGEIYRWCARGEQLFGALKS